MSVRRASRLAARQFGRIRADQLRACGWSKTSILRSVRRGWLEPRGHGVYAFGHTVQGIEQALAEALLIAGPRSALSHMVGAWWKELLRFPPAVIQVTSPHRCRRRVRGVRYHYAKSVDRAFHRGLPVLSVTQLLVQIAPTASDAALRRAVAVADRDGELEWPALEAALQPGPRGAPRLRDALQHHMPQLAHTLSPLEDRFLLLCERYGIPLPEVNVEVNGCTVDALWRREGLAVELDGREEHGTPAAVVRDRRRERAYRKANLDVIRYGGDQIDHDPADTAADLLAALARR